MTSSVPWSVKGIDRKARETAKDMARRSGMTLGEWLNHVIEYQGEGKVTPLPQTATLNEAIERLTSRVEAVEARSTLAITGIDQSVRGLAARIDNSERSRPGSGDASVADALKTIEASLSRIAVQVYENETAQNAALIEVRDELARLARQSDASDNETRLKAMEGQIAQADQRSARAVEGIGHQVMRMAETLSRQVEGVEQRTTEAVGKVNADVARIADQVGGRLRQADEAQAAALEKLGDEIERITERLNDRISQSQLRAAQGFEGPVGEPSPFAERIRDSEARTLSRLGEARETIDHRLEEIRPIEDDIWHDAVAEAVADTVEPTHAELAAHAESLAQGRAEAEDLDPFALDESEDPFADSTAEPVRASADVAAPPVIYPSQDGERSDYAFAPQDFEIVTADPLPAETGAALEEAVEPDDSFDDDLEFATPELGAADPFAPTLSFEPDTLAIADQPVEDLEAVDADPFAESTAEPATALATMDTVDDAPFQVSNAALDEAEAFEPGPFGHAQPHASDDMVAETADDHAEAAEDEFVGAAENAPEQPASRLEFIERARAAARQASQEDVKRGRGGFKFGGLSLGRQRGGAKLKSGLLMSTAVLVCLGSGLVGAAMLAPLLKDQGGAKLTDKQPRKPDAQPRAAMMTNPQPIAPAAVTPVLPTAARVAGAPAKVGDADASMVYAESLSLLSAKDKKGVELLRKAANAGYPQAELQLGHLYETGFPGLPSDLNEARKWTEKAAEAGLPGAMHNLAMLIYNGEGGPKSQALAAQWFRQAAELGQVDSQFNLGLLYENGKGVRANPAEAYKWFLLASRGGDPQSRAEARAASQRVRPLLSADAMAAAERAAQAYGAQASAK